MKPSVLALVGAVDAVAEPAGPLPFDAAYKEWYHFNLSTPRAGVVVNLGVAGGARSGVRDCGTVIVLAHRAGRGWCGGIDAYSGADVSPARGVAMRLGGCELTYADGAYHLSAALMDGSVEVSARLEPSTFPVAIRNRVAFGGGSNDWVIVPRLAVTGQVRIGTGVHPLTGGAAYHDHNRGRWHWDDDLGWDWGYAHEPAADGVTLVFERITDRWHRPVGEGGAIVWSGERVTKAFLADHLSVAYGPLRPLPWGAVPPVLGIVRGRAPTMVPSSVTATAREGGDWVELAFTPAAALQVLLPHERGDGYASIHEMWGTYRARGRVRGGAIGFTTDGFCEWAAA
jgi:hypothetical protein